jgi:hypothetical protein
MVHHIGFSQIYAGNVLQFSTLLVGGKSMVREGIYNLNIASSPKLFDSVWIRVLIAL